jgi:hypothetical protein
MRKNILISVILIIVFCIVFFACEEPVGKEERLDEFESDLNSDSARTSIYHNLHPDKQDLWRSGAAWDTTEFRWDYQPFSFSVALSGSTAAGTMTYSLDTVNVTITFREDDEDNAYIWQANVDGIDQF